MSKSFKQNKGKREKFQPPGGIPISEMLKLVNILQSNLAEAIASGNTEHIKTCTNRILRSKMAQYTAVYKTISSLGSRTPGINDPKRPNTQSDYEILRSKLWDNIKSPKYYQSSPLLRVYIPKPKGGFRPISVPSYFDRCLQHLYNLVLDVFQESQADSKSFGFRKFRSPGWAAKSITLAVWSRKGFGPPKFAIQLDIEKCFDRISHAYILSNISKFNLPNDISIQIIPHNIMKSWLDISKQVFTILIRNFNPLATYSRGSTTRRNHFPYYLKYGT